MKQENSGYPDWCKTDEDKDKYISEYEVFEGIKLEKSKICINEGLRAISKMFLGSILFEYQQDKICHDNHFKRIV